MPTRGRRPAAPRIEWLAPRLQDEWPGRSPWAAWTTTTLDGLVQGVGMALPDEAAPFWLLAGELCRAGPHAHEDRHPVTRSKAKIYAPKR